MSRRAMLFWFGGMALVLATCVVGPPVYFATEIRGRVVEAGSGEPLEGAVVVAAWIPMELRIHGDLGPTMHLEEEETDADGRFVIPGWGPKLRRPLTYFLNDDPRLTIFKTGYVPRVLFNWSGSWWRIVRTSDWDDKTIELERFEGTAQERYFQLASIAAHAGGDQQITATLDLAQEILSEKQWLTGWPPHARVLFDSLQKTVKAPAGD